MRTRYYSVGIDDYGVLCVEPLEYDTDEATEQDAARLAEAFPETIYFAVEPPPTKVELLRQAIISMAERELWVYQNTSPHTWAVIAAFNEVHAGSDDGIEVGNP